MFDIEYKGGNALKITTKKTTLVTDPKLSVIGLNDLSTKNTVELLTEDRFAVSKDAVITINSPGEFEVSDVAVRGVAATRHLDSGSDVKNSTIYRIEIGDVRIALFGNVGDDLSDEQLETVGVVDMIILPVGGNGYTLDATAAAKMIRRVDARAIIPVHYSDNAIKYEVAQDSFDQFMSAMSGATVEEVSKLKVKAAGSLPAVLTVFKLTRS